MPNFGEKTKSVMNRTVKVSDILITCSVVIFKVFRVIFDGLWTWRQLFERGIALSTG